MSAKNGAEILKLSILNRVKFDYFILEFYFLLHLCSYLYEATKE